MFSLRADGLGKAYRIYKRPIDSLKELFLRKDYAETFWALRDVSFEVMHGGALGIIGDNGAGKSTLLKLLAGASEATVGRVERAGRTASMLSLGAGFHADLSGVENIRVGCAVLGLSPAETDRIAPAIIEFSELGSFISRPVRTYSSGMQLRLGFSVATAIDPDLLVVDEHLSVGDEHFRHKCMRRIMELQKNGCALVLCSHDLHTVREVCERTLWLRDGRPAMLAETARVVDAYQDHVRSRDAIVTESSAAPIETQPDRPIDNYLKEAALSGDAHGGVIETGGILELRVVAHLTETAFRDGVHVAVMIVRSDTVWCYGVTSKWDGLSALYPLGQGDYGVKFVVEGLPLLAGQYSFIVSLMDEQSPHVYHTISGVASFTVTNNDKDVGVSRLPHRWVRP